MTLRKPKLRTVLVTLVTLVASWGVARAVDNYAATAGSGLTFGAKLISAVLYPEMLLCDGTVGTTCAKVQVTSSAVAGDTGVTVTAPNTDAILASAQPAGTNRIGYVSDDPCQKTGSYFPINISSATTTRIIAEVAAQKAYICSIHLVVSAAENIAMIEGTGATCAGGTPAGMAGGTTAGSGWNITGNGLSLGAGGYSIAATANAAYSVCLVTSGTSQVSGTVKYVQQ